MNPTVTRKEIAEADSPTIGLKELTKKIGVSKQTILRKERKWGLHRARSAASERPLWFRKTASTILRRLAVISEPL